MRFLNTILDRSVTYLVVRGPIREAYFTIKHHEEWRMASDSAETHQGLSPDDAFSVLGSETRMKILQTLGDAEGPLSFTELRDMVGIRQGAQFNYHLEQLVGHFIRQIDAGYVLRQPGRRVIEAVLSGAITETPRLEPTELDIRCELCGAPTIISYRAERVSLYCTECDGFYGPQETSEFPSVSGLGFLGEHAMPPAGLRGRSAREVFAAAETWQMTQLFTTASKVCPRCAAPLEPEFSICETHDSSLENCTQCGRQHAVHIEVSCTNCIYQNGGVLAHLCLTNTEFLSFMTSNGVNPISPRSGFYEVLSTHQEELISTDPLEVRLTFTIENDTLSLTIDNTLDIYDISTCQEHAEC